MSPALKRVLALARKALVPLLTLALLGLTIRQYQAIQRYQSDIRRYQHKVEQTFQYVLVHANCQTFPHTLEELAASPSPALFTAATDQATEFSDLLGQLNDLRDARPRTDYGLQTGSYVDAPAAKAQEDLGMQIFLARMWPPIYTMDFRRRSGHPVTPADQQFLRQATPPVRHICDVITQIQARAIQFPDTAEIWVPLARQEFEGIAPDLVELQRLRDTYTESLR